MFGRGDSRRKSRSRDARRLNFESLEHRVVMSATSLVPDESAAADPVVATEPTSLPALSIEDWVHGLLYTQFNQLTVDTVRYVTPQQIATIPNGYDFQYFMSAPVRAALSQPQVQALRVSTIRLNFLTPQQISWLSVVQIPTLQTADLKYLGPAQVPFVTPAQIATIPDPGPFAEWTSASRAALTLPQIQALRVGTVWLDRLTPTQISWLTPAQIQTLRVPDFKYLSPNQVPHLTTAQIAAIPDPGPFSEWNASSVAALTPPQIQALDVGSVWLVRLTPTQISWLTAAQIKTLRVPDFRYLSPNQVPHLTTAQIAAIPDPGPFSEWSASSVAALTFAQIQALDVGSVWLVRLTSTQISWITPAQVKTLRVPDFKYLSPNQVPHLTTAQIAAIPDPGPFSEWSTASRAALTLTQVQALDVGNVWLDRLTPLQLSWLTVAQIPTLRVADFRYLNAFQTPWLTTAQIADISDPALFASWAAGARAALTRTQIQALKVGALGAALLTPVQASWLTPLQVQSLPARDLKVLNSLQVPLLTNAQIEAASYRGLFAQWSDASRAALTQTQIRSLNVSDVGVDLLTPTQIGWLTTGQLRTLNWTQFFLLRPDQIPLLTPLQIASIPTGVLRTLPDQLQTAVTREQFMALSSEQISSYMSSLAPPYGSYTPTVDIPVGSDGVQVGHSGMFEPALNLVPLAAATHVATGSGNWSDPRIWQGGAVPTPGARVVIAAGATVRYDVSLVASMALETLRIDGALNFATDRSTQLYVDTIVVNTAGKLHIGTALAPIADYAIARIVITGGGPIDTTWDPYVISRGLISRGEVQMHGKSVTPYAALATALTRGATLLRFTEIPTNWRVGDKIVITGTQQHVAGSQSEERLIRAISGGTVTVDALAYDHVPPAGIGATLYAANFTRNIQFVAADTSVASQRPHMMFMQNPNVDIANISVVGFGRTDKTVPINDPVVVSGVLQPGTGTNVRARYAIHFHHTGVNPDYAPAVVRGSVVVDSAGWGYVNHQSNVLMEDNVSYNVVGAGFVAEDGNEIGSMIGNLAMNSTGSGDHIESRRAIHDWGHGGHGFWMQGPGIALVDNIAVGHADAAFVYFTNSARALYDAVNLSDPALAGGRDAIPVGTAPIKAFVGNTAATSKTGLEVWFHQTFMNDGQSYVENFKGWNLRSSGVFLLYVGRLTIRNATLIGDMNLFRGEGINSIGLTHDLTVINPRVEGWEIGVKLGHRRANVLYGGVINAVQGINIKGAYDTIRTIDIVGTTINTPTLAQLHGRTSYQIYLTGKPDFEFQSVESILAPDRIRIMRYNYTLATLFYEEAAPDYVAFPRSEYLGMVPDEYLDLTNAQLRARFGVSIGGGYPPSDAVTPVGYRARVDFTPGR